MVQNNPIYIKRLEIENEIQNGDLMNIANSKVVKPTKVVKPIKDEIKKSKKNGIKSYIGLILFIFIFTFLISNVLHDLGYYAFLLGYLPNQDLVATVLTRWGGPYGIWKELYPEEITETQTWLSVNIINYTALLGLTYVVAKEVYEHNDLHMGWSMVLLMALMTYLLPSPVITHVMDKVYGMFPKYNSLAVFMGFMTVFAIMYVETYILTNYRPFFIKISKTIVDLGNIV